MTLAQRASSVQLCFTPLTRESAKYRLPLEPLLSRSGLSRAIPLMSLPRLDLYALASGGREGERDDAMEG